jgi:hypothetical protein
MAARGCADRRLRSVLIVKFTFKLFLHCLICEFQIGFPFAGGKRLGPGEGAKRARGGERGGPEERSEAGREGDSERLGRGRGARRAGKES